MVYNRIGNFATVCSWSQIRWISLNRTNNFDNWLSITDVADILQAKTVTLEDHELTLAAPTLNCAISVSGVPENLKAERLKIYFENRSRGGPVQDIKPGAEIGEYIVTFENHEGTFFTWHSFWHAFQALTLDNQ